MMRLLTAVRLAFAMLTVVPLPRSLEPATEAELAEARWAFPLVGCVLGAVLAAISAGLVRAHTPPLVAGFLLLATGALLTGGLHLDGLADSADGLLLRGDRQQRLAAMREPQVGSFGVLAVVLVILGKFAALASLAEPRRASAVFLAMAASRTLLLVAAGLAPYAREEGTGRLVVDSCSRQDAVIAAGLALVMGVAMAGIRGFIACLIALGAALGVTTQAQWKLGGVTGDILGALAELAEMAVLICIVLLKPL